MKSNLKENLIRFSRIPFTAAGRTNKDTSFKWMGMPGTHSFPLAFCLLLACLHPWVKNLSKVAWARHQGSKNENTMGWIELCFKFHIEPSKWNPLLIGNCQKTPILNLFIRWQGHHRGKIGKTAVLPEFCKYTEVLPSFGPHATQVAPWVNLIWVDSKQFT